MSRDEKIVSDIAEAQKIIRMNPEFFAQLYEYRNAKLAFDALWASIRKREGSVFSINKTYTHRLEEAIEQIFEKEAAGAHFHE